MCGRYNIIDSPAVQALLTQVGIDIDPRHLRMNNDCAPMQPVQIVRNIGMGAELVDAIWHFYLVADGDRWKPRPKAWSINSRSDKLDTRPEYKTQRCLLPATGFVESQSGKRPHLLRFPGRAFFFGGLYKEYHHPTAGSVTSTTIITLPGHAKIEHIHRQAFPLILPDTPEVIQHWLDPEFKDTQAFTDLLTPVIRWEMTAELIDKASTKRPLGTMEFIDVD